MSNPIDIVPPLELCKQIPDGEFADSVLCWVDAWRACVLPENAISPQRQPFVELRRYTIPGDDIPAPTLQEILEALTKLCVTPEICYANKNYWQAQSKTLDDDGMFNYRLGGSRNPATAALKLWLKLKGVEV